MRRPRAGRLFIARNCASGRGGCVLLSWRAKWAGARAAGGVRRTDLDDQHPSVAYSAITRSSRTTPAHEEQGTWRIPAPVARRTRRALAGLRQRSG